MTHLTLVRLARLQSRRNRRSISGWHAVLESRTPIRICSGHRLSVAVFGADWTKGSRERRVYFKLAFSVSEPNPNKCLSGGRREVLKEQNAAGRIGTNARFAFGLVACAHQRIAL